MENTTRLTAAEIDDLRTDLAIMQERRGCEWDEWDDLPCFGKRGIISRMNDKSSPGIKFLLENLQPGATMGDVYDLLYDVENND